VTDERGVALGVCYSNGQSLALALQRRIGVYWSRKRGLWVKGETSGATQTLHHVGYDCDRDVLIFRVTQHAEVRTGWGS
jgi:phosphoribosyl-AMP cyclohydrolase